MCPLGEDKVLSLCVHGAVFTGEVPQQTIAGQLLYAVPLLMRTMSKINGYGFTCTGCMDFDDLLVGGFFDDVVNWHIISPFYTVVEA